MSSTLLSLSHPQLILFQQLATPIWEKCLKMQKYLDFQGCLISSRAYTGNSQNCFCEWEYKNIYIKFDLFCQENKSNKEFKILKLY